MKNRKTRNLIISIVLHCLLLIAVYTFQGAILPYLRIGGYVPLILPVAVTGIALYEGRDTGGVYGLFAGILCDVSFNQPVGTFTVVLTLVGLCVGALADAIILSGFVTYLLSCTVVLILCAIVQMTPIIAMPNNIPTRDLAIRTAFQTLYSLVMAIPIWFPVRALSRYVQRVTIPAERK